MSLLVDPKNTFEITLVYKAQEKGVSFFNPDEKIPEGAITEKFTFRKPNWRDTRIIMSASTIGNSPDALDPLAYTEAKVRTLLVDWSLKDKDDKPLPIQKFDFLTPAVILKLSALIDEQLGEAGLVGLKA